MYICRWAHFQTIIRTINICFQLGKIAKSSNLPCLFSSMQVWQFRFYVLPSSIPPIEDLWPHETIKMSVTKLPLYNQLLLSAVCCAAVQQEIYSKLQLTIACTSPTNYSETLILMNNGTRIGAVDLFMWQYGFAR